MTTPAALPEQVDVAIAPNSRDLGGFEVRRALPSPQRRMIGPFVFWDEFGPAMFAPGHGLDVRPHPHINLATITYLFDGEILHRDSLGSEQTITPGAVNLMVAGRGIAHSERTGAALRARGSMLAGIQSWIALPTRDEETAPAFHHHDGAALPRVEAEGFTAHVIMGEAFGAASPVKTFSEMIYADVQADGGARVKLDAQEERGAYLVSGEIEIDGQSFGPNQLIVFKPDAEIVIGAKTPARFMIIGGAALDGPRHVWWNFVSSRRERIEQAKDDWKAGRFGLVPGDTEDFIPLPEA